MFREISRKPHHEARWETIPSPPSVTRIFSKPLAEALHELLSATRGSFTGGSELNLESTPVLEVG